MGCSGLGSIRVPHNVTSLKSGAFSNCGFETAGPVGRGCDYEFEWTQKIPDYAFDSIDTLQSVILPDTITEIGVSAFKGCTNLNSIDLPDSVSTIGGSAFSDCRSLKEFRVPAGTSCITRWMLAYCTGLTSIIIPDTVTEIEKEAFWGCGNLSKVSISGNVKSIGTKVFSDCGFETAGPIGSNKDFEFGWTESIPTNAFYGCTKLKNIEFPSGITLIDSYAFYKTGLEEVAIPDSVVEIDDYAFANCDRLSALTIPASVTELGVYPFSECIRLNSAGPFGSGCDYEFEWAKKIPGGAFAYCTGLERIIIPDGVTWLSGEFQGCSNLSYIAVGDNNNGLVSVNGVLYDKDMKTLICCPARTTGSFAIPDTVEEIDGFAFSCCNISNVIIPDSVTFIDQWAFEQCTELTSVTIPESVDIIDNGYTFKGCSKLESVNLSPKMTYINRGMFWDCTSLRSVQIPNGVKSIDEYAFCDCHSLEEITIPASVKQIGISAFGECYNLANIYYGSSEANWNKYEFAINNYYFQEATIHYGSDPVPDDDPIPDGDDPINPCPTSWIWGKDNYSFTNSYDFFGNKGEKTYVDNKDFTSLLSNYDNTDIAMMASWFGAGNALTPKKIKLYNFLTNRLCSWGGSCYGMSLTAALFKSGKKDAISFGGSNTHDITALNKSTNSKLESFINVYHMTQACSKAMNNVISCSIRESGFSSVINNLYDRAISDNSKQEPLIIYLQADTNNDGKSEGGHAVLCYGAEEGSWTTKGYNCDRRLLIADPNMDEETYIYISRNSQFATYSGDADYNEFGYYASSLDSLNSFDYNETVIDMVYNIILSTRNNVIIVGHEPYGKVVIKDGHFTVDDSSVDFFVDAIRKMSDEGDSDADTFYRISGKSAYYEILPLDEGEIDTSLYLNDFGVDIKGAINSATIDSNGSITLNDANGEMSVDIAQNNSDFDFTHIQGDAKGDVNIKLSNKQLSVDGKISDYSVSNLDKNLNESEITVKDDEDIILTLDNSNKLLKETVGNNDNEGNEPKDLVPEPGSDPKKKGKDGTAVGKGASAAAAEKAITSMKSDTDPKGSVFNKLRLKSTKQTKSSITLKWKKNSKAVKYVVYGNKCGKAKPKRLKTVKGSKSVTAEITKIAGKKLKKGTYYKFIVVALDKNNKVVSTSKLIHVATKGGKAGNYKSVTVKKSVLTKAKKLKKGKTLKLNAKAVAQSKKLPVKKHVAVRYESTNNKIATVNKSGKVTAKKKGSCYIYAYTQNGFFKKIKMIVK